MKRLSIESIFRTRSLFSCPKSLIGAGVASLMLLFANDVSAQNQGRWQTNAPLSTFGSPPCVDNYSAWYNGRAGIMTIGAPAATTTLHLHSGLRPTDDFPCEPVRLRLQSADGVTASNLFVPAYVDFFSNRMNNANQWQVASIQSELFTPVGLPVLTAGNHAIGGLKFFGGTTVAATGQQKEVFRIGDGKMGIGFDETGDNGALPFQLPIAQTKLELFGTNSPDMRITGGPCTSCVVPLGTARYTTLQFGVATADVNGSVLGKAGDIFFRTAGVCQKDIRMSVQGYSTNAYNKFRVETGNIDGGITEKAVFGADQGTSGTPYPAYHGTQDRTHSVLELRRSDRKDGNANPTDPPRFRDQNNVIRFTRVNQYYSQLPIPNSVYWLVGVDGMNKDASLNLGDEGSGPGADNQFKINQDVFRITPMRVPTTQIPSAEFPTGDVPGITVNSQGQVLINCDETKAFSGTTNPTNIPTDFKLGVKGMIVAQEVVVTNTGWADFVFKKDYKLRPLEEVEQFINDNGHLPDVPSENDVKKTGLDLGKNDAMLLQKIEELTLYMLQLKKENDVLKEKIEHLSSSK